MTPNNSMSPSPLDSPPHGSPVHAPVKDDHVHPRNKKNKLGGPMMTFMPILPPEDPLSSSSKTNMNTRSGSGNPPTPPETPTFPERALPGGGDVQHHPHFSPPSSPSAGQPQTPGFGGSGSKSPQAGASAPSSPNRNAPKEAAVPHTSTSSSPTT